LSTLSPSVNEADPGEKHAVVQVTAPPG